MKKKLIPGLIALIKNESDLKKIRNKLLEFHPYDLASIIKKLEPDSRFKIYASLTNKELADIFSYLEGEDSAELFHELEESKGAAILEEMDVDDAVDLLQEMEAEKAADYLNLIDSEIRADISYLARQQESSVGSIMTTNYIEVNQDCDVKEAMKILVREASDAEVIDPIYITDAGRLVGILDLKTLIIARSPLQVKEIMKTNYVFAEKDEDIEDAAGKIRDYGLSSLPVLDYGNLVGIITIDDAMDVINEEASYNYGSLAGVGNDTEKERSIFSSLRKRLPWLLGLLVLSFITASIIGGFEGIIKEVTILIFFQSLILDMVGNVGTQSLAVTLMGLTHGELDDKRELRANIFREIRIALINSFLIAILTFLVVSIFLLIRSYNGNVWEIGLFLAIAMFFTINASAIIGVIIPIFFEKIGLDPAVASGPLITTINDILAVLIYYGLASLLINIF
ncbi:MAG: magnesium transporter [Bacilli bacterium]|jgi:magnesium transporter